MAGLVSWAIVKPEDPEPGQFQSGLPESGETRMAAPEDEWGAAYQKELADESMQMKGVAEEGKSSDMAAAPEPEPEPQPEPEPPQIGEAVTQLESERANTGSVSLDREVYPVPFETTATAGAESAEPLLLPIIIPIVVIVAGIILERLLARRARNKINQIT